MAFSCATKSGTFCAPGDPKCGPQGQNRVQICGQLVRLVHHHGKCVCAGNFMHVVRRFFTNYQLWCSGFSCSRVEVVEWRAVSKNFVDNWYAGCLIMVGVPMVMGGCTASQGKPPNM